MYMITRKQVPLLALMKQVVEVFVESDEGNEITLETHPSAIDTRYRPARRRCCGGGQVPDPTPP